MYARISRREQGRSWQKGGKTMTVMDYQTRNGLADYGFSIEFQPDIGWRVYIVFHPFHHNTLHLPYRTIDDKGRYYVDWPGKLDSLGEAKTVAGLWAELVEHHLRIQQQKALYIELIEHYRRTHNESTPPNRDHLGDAVNSDMPELEQHDRDPAINLPTPRQSR